MDSFVLNVCSICTTVGPNIAVEVVDQTQNETETASFSCQATGQPVPTISWYFNDVLVDVTDTTKYAVSVTSLNITTNNSTLTIMSVQSSDVGTYTCNATNVVSSNTSSGVLTVNGEDYILWCDVCIIGCFIVSANIVEPEEGQEFTITEGNNGSFTCTATGYPPPTVIWQNSDGSSLSNMRLVSGSEVVSSTGVGNETSVSVELMVTGVMRVDTGMYTCSASNIVNSTTTNVIITVQCKLIIQIYIV